MTEKFLVVIMLNSQLSILRESNQCVAGPLRHARDIRAPAFEALTVKIGRTGETDK